MATYNQLLIEAGGGIVNRHQQSEQQSGAAVAIGIGGTGASALRKLKREVYREIKPDNPDSAVPSYKHIKFLLIDSDNSKLETYSDIADIDLRTEYFDISCRAVKKIFASREILEKRPELSWLNYKHITVKETGEDGENEENGAGGIRQVGRFQLFEKAASLCSRLKAVLNDALTGVQDGNISIHIFSGLSGGTGGGCFIDICYILRYVLEQLGRDNAQICGYFFMPDVNLSIPSAAANPRISRSIEVNGYAALKELDYLMDLGVNGDGFDQNYGLFSVHSELPPVDSCYLISSTQADGTPVENGYEYAVSVAADYVLSFLAKAELPEGCEAGNTDGGQTLLGHIANLEQARAGVKKTHGAFADYNIIGVSDATIPLSDITTYLGVKLFDSFAYMRNQSPTMVELNDFAIKSQITFEDILNQLTKGIHWKIVFPDYDKRILKSGNSVAVEQAERWFSGVLEILEKNSKMLKEDLQEYHVPRNSASLIGRTFRQLHDLYAADYEKGPFFAMRLLGGKDNRNFLHIIDGYVAKANAQLDAEIRTGNAVELAMEKAQTNLSKANFMNLSGRCSEYLRCLNRQYIHLGRIKQYQIMIELLRSFRRQVVQLNNDFFKVLTMVLDTLQDTFRENRAVLTSGASVENRYTWSILSIPDIKDSLDDEVEKMDLSQVTREFMEVMFAEYKSWMSQDSNKIRKMVSDFVVDKFDALTRKTFLDYLKIKFETADSAKLQEKIGTEIIKNKLAERSEPLFWCNSMFAMDEAARSCVLSVPFHIPEIVRAAEEFCQGDGQFTIRKTRLTDRMSMMRFCSGVPLYAYQGLQQLELAYENDNKPGRHLYETPKKDWNKFLPSPIPASLRISGYRNVRVEKINERLKREFEKAREKGIIYQDNEQWVICERKAEVLKEIADQVMESQIRNSEDIREVRILQQKLLQIQTEMEKPENRSMTIINTKGADNLYVENVLLDNYFRYPVLNQRVAKELKKLDLLEHALARTYELLNDIGAEEKYREHFFNALFTGCIRMLPSKFVYSYEEYGIETSVDLQNAKMTYSRCGIYQAFLTYRSLDNELRKRIDEETAEKLDGMNQEIYQCAVKLYEKYNKALLKLILSSVETEPKYKEIEFFYKEFMKALQTHLQLYK